jgi:hypothetical protein
MGLISVFHKEVLRTYIINSPEYIVYRHLQPSRLQFNDKFSNQINGGVLVYYVSAQPGKITAFKPVISTRTSRWR